MVSDKLSKLQEQRRALRPLLSPHDPADALASNYALWHDPKRTQLLVRRNAQGNAEGFVAVCQTGADLFRPLVTLRAPDANSAGQLLREALVPHRPYQVMVPVVLASAVREHLDVRQSRLLSIYRLEPARFQPIINVLVQRSTGPDGTPRFQIESQGKAVAVSGTNWRSPTFAEVYVYVDPLGRNRGWGKSVASACTASLLEARISPLYLVEDGNDRSAHLAEELGYVDTGLREFAAEGQIK